MSSSKKVTVKLYCSFAQKYVNAVYEFETITTKLGRKVTGPKGYVCEGKKAESFNGHSVENSCACGIQYIKFLKNKNIVSKPESSNPDSDINTESQFKNTA
jgi:hypothetical protein